MNYKENKGEHKYDEKILIEPEQDERKNFLAVVQKEKEKRQNPSYIVGTISKNGKLFFGEDEFKIIKMKGDGNCLFRCLAMLVYGDQEKYQLMREKIVKYVVDGWNNKKEWIWPVNDTVSNVKNDFVLYKTAAEYENEMKPDKRYGTDF